MNERQSLSRGCTGPAHQQARQARQRARPQYLVVIGWMSLGLGPYWFGPGLPSSAHRTMRAIPPNAGMSPISISHPLIPMSCSRRAQTARDGTKAASPYTAKRIPNMAPSADPRVVVNDAKISNSSTSAITMLTSVKIQYSLRRERPVKSAYLRQTIRYHSMAFSPEIASANLTLQVQKK